MNKHASNILRKLGSWSDIYADIDALVGEYLVDARPVASRCGVKFYTPRIDTGQRELEWTVNIPREFRHPDEYSYKDSAKEQAYEEWSNIEDEITTVLEEICTRYGYELVISGSPS